ncbi:hypothetical protein D3C75_861050 [compost metagenome]
MRVDHHSEQREEEQRGFRVETVGDETRGKGTTGRALAGFLVQIVRHRLGRLRAQCLVTDVQQVSGGGPFQGVEQHDRLGHDQADTQERVTHVQENRRAHTQCGPGARAAAVGNTFTYHHGKVRAGAGHGQQVNQGNGQELCPVHVGLLQAKRNYLFHLVGSADYAFSSLHKRYS